MSFVITLPRDTSVTLSPSEKTAFAREMGALGASVTIAPDRAALLASLQVTGRATTAKGFTYRMSQPRDPSRPFAVCPNGANALVTSHESPALAVARLVTL